VYEYWSATVKHSKVLLINPFPERAGGINEATIYPPIGLAYLASYLRDMGLSVRIIDANILRLDNGRLLRMMEDCDPDLVGISLNAVTVESGARLSRQLKENTDIPVCIGGPYVTSSPERALALSSADVAVLHEGEVTLLEICEGKEISEIKGIAFMADGGQPVITEPRPMIPDLDSLPHPAYDLLPPLGQYKSRARRRPVGPIITSRGCPFQCIFCHSDVFGKRFRARSPENVIEEIDTLVNRYGVRQIDVLDDNFTLDMKRAEKILDLIIEREYDLRLNLQSGVRADRVTYPLVRKMKKAGVFKAGIGIESGDEDVLKSAKKSLDLEKVVQAVEWFRSEGIVTIGFFIIGFPMDTKGSIEATIDFAIRLNPSIANFSLLIPFPGTEAYDFLKANGLLVRDVEDGIASGFYGGKVYHRTVALSEDEIASYVGEAYRRFYLRPSKMLDMVTSIRSLGELKWMMETAVPVLKKVLFGSNSHRD
jgi:anaerobic magnesium-protoporphyrin IX monomethyl ester cyclase